MTIDHREIGKRIARYRKINGLTAAQLAGRVRGLTRETLAKIETGKRSSLDVVVIADIADALGVSLLALLVPLDRATDPNALSLLERLDGRAATNSGPAGAITDGVINGMRLITDQRRRLVVGRDIVGQNLDEAGRRSIETQIEQQASLTQALATYLDPATALTEINSEPRADG